MYNKFYNKDYDNISSLLYEKVLEDYLSKNKEDYFITSQNFINLSTQEELPFDIINEILDKIKYKNIHLVNNKIESEKIRIDLKVSIYNKDFVKILVYKYYGKNLKRIDGYNGTYKNKSWKLELDLQSHLD